MLLNGFDRLAPFYDRLTSFVFGASMRRAQIFYFKRIPSGSKVLILGGGTGWSLRELVHAQPDCEVWYVESSSRMLGYARKQGLNHARIHFIQGTEADIPIERFDVIVTHFFLDLFNTVTLNGVVQKILQSSKPGVVWLVADFIDRGTWWQRWMLQTMYLFFRWSCRIEAAALPRWEETMRLCGLNKLDAAHFYAGFIESAVYAFPAER